MSILGGAEILRRVESGEIEIEPFRKERLNPNSYNLSLGDSVATYALKPGEPLDPKQPGALVWADIPPEGLVLSPGELYLAHTEERTKTLGAAPMLQGRSSIARLGLFVHVTAGFGDNGFDGRWTLELVAVKPVRVYAGMQICQIAYHAIEGGSAPYTGRYQHAEQAQPCRMWLDEERQHGD